MVIQGDCIEALKSIQDKSVDLIITDLPYGTTANKWDVKIQLNELWPEMIRVKKDGSPVILFGCQPFTTELINSNPKMFRYELIWEKSKAQGFLGANKRPLRVHENILIFCEKQPKYNPQKIKGKPYKTNAHGPCANYDTHRKPIINETGDRYPKSIIKINNEIKTKHPTQKPVKLIEWLIKTYSNSGDIVLDCTAGSGTTAVAAINTKRNYIIIEKDEKYIEIAKNRIKEAENEINNQLTMEAV